MTLTVEELEARWNACADRSNQWSELGLDEIVAFAQYECAREMADMAGNMAAISWAEWDERADPIDQGKALALEHFAALVAAQGVPT